MEGVNVHVTVDQVTLDTIVGSEWFHGNEENYSEPVTLADRVARLILNEVKNSHLDRWNALLQRVTEIRDEEIRKAIAPRIEKALTRPIKRTNRFGEETGEEPITLSDLIMDEMHKALTAKRDRFEDHSPVHKMIRDEVAKAFQADVREQVKQAREAVAGQLGADLSKQITDAAIRALGSR